MTKMNKEQHPSMDDRIKSILKEGPLAGFYFYTAIVFLKEHVEKSSDDELLAMFDNLLSPALVRHSVTTIYNRLNLTDEK